MILIGACLQAAREEGAIAVIEASLKQGEKRYVIHRFDERLFSEPEAFAEAIASLVRDGGLRRAKRLFSQDRRPKKTVMDAPKVVAYDDGSPVVNALRGCGMVVEAVRFVPGKEWEKELVGKALGANYAVDPAQVSASAGKPIAEGRAGVADSFRGSGFDRISGELVALAAARPDQLPAGGLAVALPLWFRETVPYRRAYRAT